MKLSTALEEINKTPIKLVLTAGYAKTVEELWNNFIEPRILPNVATAKKWHKLLMNYIKCPDAVFSIRHYSSAPKGKYVNNRRGAYTKTTEGFSFVYTDNIQAKYYCKMCMDGYVPQDANELITAYKEFLFPASERTTSEESELRVFPYRKINFSGYHLAHIIGVGDAYWDKSKGNFPIQKDKLVETYFNGGKRSDWNKTKCRENFIVGKEARSYAVAMFLRYVHPFNYFLSPAKKYTKSEVKFFRGMVGEHPPVIQYVRQKIAEIYGQDYIEFSNLVMPIDDYKQNISGNTIIDLQYSDKLLR